MLTALLQEQKRLLAKIEAMETQLETERTAALAALPANFGHADLDSFIKELRRAAGEKSDSPKGSRKKRTVSAPVSTSVAKPAGLMPIGQAAAQAAAAPKPAVASLPISTPVAAAPAPAVLPEPTGTSLDDPANFGLLPDTSLLAQSSQDLAVYHGKLSVAVKFAQKVLHTSKVQARIWREWRQFERAAVELLRASAPGSGATAD
jgi:hypothetical protein